MQASQELAAVGDPGPRADATDVEPDAQPARRGHRRVRRQVDVLGDCRPRGPVHAAARRHGGPAKRAAAERGLVRGPPPLGAAASSGAGGPRRVALAELLGGGGDGLEIEDDQAGDLDSHRSQT